MQSWRHLRGGLPATRQEYDRASTAPMTPALQNGNVCCSACGVASYRYSITAPPPGRLAREITQDAIGLQNAIVAAGASHQLAALAGNSISNRVTPPLDETRTVPLCAIMIDLVIANPKPAPSVDRCRDGSTR
jgi:hypothetical protein